MKTLRRALIAVCVGIAGLAAACASMDVSSNFDPTVDFGQGFHSYAWVPDAEMKDTGVKDPLVDKLLREAIDDEMATHGFARATDAPDFLITYQAGIERRIESRPASGGSVMLSNGGYRGASFGVSSGSDVYQYDEGTLILDFLRGDERKLVWRGTVSKAVNKSDSRDERLATARAAVAKMLAEFPPRKSD